MPAIPISATKCGQLLTRKGDDIIIMLKKDGQNEDKQRLDWHSGFEGGLKLSLRNYAKDIQVEREHPLSSEPLRIDFLVVKKHQKVYVDNAIGRRFRTYNLLEYKNPNDNLNVDVLWKNIGYASLYKSFGRTVDEIKSDELTIYIFRAAKPKELFKLLDKSRYTIKLVESGVYQILGIIDIPIYIVVISELEDKKLIPLTVMQNRVNEKIVRQFLDEARKYTEPGDKRYADAVLQISAGANKELYDKLKGEKDMCEALRELMADELRDAKNEGIEQGIEQRDYDKISDMLLRGKDPEEIASFCNYPLQQVLEVKKSLEAKG